MLFSTFVQVVVPLVPRYAVAMGVQPFMIGLASSSISVTAITFRPIGGLLSDKWSRKNLVAIGIALVSASYIVLALSRSMDTL
ncbi:MAG: hypothetical protein QW335_07175 [Candidatus Nezhaarchaeales archaeon]